MFFKNVDFDSYPKDKNISVFACDDIYFKKYGIYTLISLDKLLYNTHIHLINPTKESIETYKQLLLKLAGNHSFSAEYLDFSTVSEPEKKSYFFMSRYFLSQYLFSSFDIENMFIIDADLIFNHRIELKSNVNIAFNYRPERNTLWERSAAYLVYVTRNRKSFIDEIIEEYRTRHLETNFEEIPKLEKKIDRVNLAGLDQVCLTSVLERQDNIEDFFNLRDIESLESKGEFSGKIWVLVGKNKRLLADDYLKLKYKEYF